MPAGLTLRESERFGESRVQVAHDCKERLSVGDCLVQTQQYVRVGAVSDDEGLEVPRLDREIARLRNHWKRDRPAARKLRDNGLSKRTKNTPLQLCRRCV